MLEQVIPAQRTSPVTKFKNLFSTDKKKLVVICFIIFAIGVAAQTLISELNKDKPKIPTVTTTPTPTIPNQTLPGVNSNLEVVDEKTYRYENTLIGFTFEYPSDVGLVREGGIGSTLASTVYIFIDELNNPFTQNKDQLRSDRLLLERGEFGLEINEGNYFLKGVIKTGDTNIKLYTNLKSTQCEGVTLEKVAQFYKFDRRITLILRGPTERLIKENPNYFVIGDGECDGELTWSQIGEQSFLSAVTRNSEADYILKWNNDFSKLVSTIRMVTPTDPELFGGSVKGRWQGENMVVSLVANNKLGKVTEMKLWYSDREEGSWEPFDTFKMVPSKNKINVRYKDQYGNISGVFSTQVEFKQ